MNVDLPSATFVAGIAAAIGAIVAGGITLLNAWLIRRSEERRQIRELAVRAATEEWGRHIEISEGHRTKIPPFDLYLIHAMCFVKALDGSLRTKEEIRDHLRKVHSITDAAGQEIEEYSKKQHKRNPLTQEPA